MSPVVRVRSGATAPTVLAVPELARSLPFSLSELVAAARLAGDVPLPFGYDDSGGRLASRLASGDPDLARLRRALAESVPGGPAQAALSERGLVVDGDLVAEPAAALGVLAGGRTRLVVDLAVRRPSGARSLHCWLGVQDRLVARLATVDGLIHELGWHDLGRWSQELARIATVGSPAGGGRDRGPRLPAYVSMPSALLVTGAGALAEGRPEVVDALVSAHPGEVRAGGPGHVEDVDAAGVRSLLQALSSPSGRLRVRATSGAGVGVLSWLRVGRWWHELQPGPDATTRLCRRAPADLGPALEPLAVGGGR